MIVIIFYFFLIRDYFLYSNSFYHHQLLGTINYHLVPTKYHFDFDISEFFHEIWNKREEFNSLEIEIFKVEVNFYYASSFDSRSQDVLFGRHVVLRTQTVDVIQEAGIVRDYEAILSIVE